MIENEQDFLKTKNQTVKTKIDNFVTGCKEKVSKTMQKCDRYV